MILYSHLFLHISIMLKKLWGLIPRRDLIICKEIRTQVTFKSRFGVKCELGLAIVDDNLTAHLVLGNQRSVACLIRFHIQRVRLGAAITTGCTTCNTKRSEWHRKLFHPRYQLLFVYTQGMAVLEKQMVRYLLTLFSCRRRNRKDERPLLLSLLEED